MRTGIHGETTFDDGDTFTVRMTDPTNLKAGDVHLDRFVSYARHVLADPEPDPDDPSTVFITISDRPGDDRPAFGGMRFPSVAAYQIGNPVPVIVDGGVPS